MRTFLEEMDRIVPWQTLIDEIKPFYYNNVRGRKPIELEIMLRMYLLQNWYNFSDVATEESI